MAITVGEVCAEVHNYFVDTDDIHTGDFSISGGAITPSDFLQTDQYFKIYHSAFNDGVYQNKAAVLATLKDETFSGSIWTMRVPPDFLKLCELISAWDNKYGGVNSANLSPYQSESYAGQYSYTKASGNRYGESNGAIGWQSQFASQLNRYRKLVGCI